MPILRKLLIVAFSFFGLLPLEAQVLTKSAVGLELAKKIASAAETAAAKNKWTTVIVVLDEGGNLVYLERMDGTQLGSIEVAQAKAKTALFFKRPSKSFEDRVAGGQNSMLSIPNVISIEGGLPLVVNGEIVGAIGVSGMTSAQDGQVAQAGVAALNSP